MFGVFFFVSALVQFLWCTLAVLSPSRSLLTSGVVVNVALIVLWALTRTVGLPGLLDGPEEVGPWDVSSKIWELIALVCCVLLLPRWAGHKGRDWTFSSRTGLVAGLLLPVGLGGVVARARLCRVPPPERSPRGARMITAKGDTSCGGSPAWCATPSWQSPTC